MRRLQGLRVSGPAPRWSLESPRTRTPSQHQARGRAPMLSRSLTRPGLRALQVVGEAQGPVVLRAGAAGQDPGAWSRAEASVRGSGKRGLQGSAESQARVPEHRRSRLRDSGVRVGTGRWSGAGGVHGRVFGLRRPGAPQGSVAVHGPGLGAGPGLPAWLQLLGWRRGLRRPGARQSSGFRLGGRGCGFSPTAEPRVPSPGPGQRPWQRWQYQQQPRPPPLPCLASPARTPRWEWARRGRGPAGERCLCGSGRARVGAARGAGSPAGGEPLPRPRGESGWLESGVSSFSPNGNRSGLPWLVGEGSSSRRSGGWGAEGRAGGGREGEEDGGGGGRACAPRAQAAGLALGQSVRKMLQPRGQGRGQALAPPSSPASTWVSAAAGGKEPGEGGWGGGSSV